jgi:hypothetical protein
VLASFWGSIAGVADKLMDRSELVQPMALVEEPQSRAVYTEAQAGIGLTFVFLSRLGLRGWHWRRLT